MRIVVDMQGAQNGSRFRGIGRYTTAFVKHLIQVTGKHEIVLVLSSAFPETLQPLFSEFEGMIGRGNIQVWQPVAPASFADPGSTARRKASELIREAFLASLQPDVVLVASLFEGCGDDVVTSIGQFTDMLPVAVILYDFIPFHFPDEYLVNRQLKSWYGEKLKYLKKARLLLAISGSARNEALDILRADPARVVNVSAGVDPKFQTEQGTSTFDLRAIYAITQPFLMYTGASDPRKNLPGLVAAFAALPADVRDTHQLVLAGAMSKGDTKRLKQQMSGLMLRENQVLFLGQVSDSDLIGLYRSARASIMPSYHEGFGLPVLEAMACGAPVIGSNVSSIPEAVGLDEALFDPHSTASMAAAIQQVLQDDVFRRRLIAHGTAHCAKFTWESVARKGLAALEAAFGPDVPCTRGVTSSEQCAVLDRLIPLLGQTLAENRAVRSDYVKTAASVAANFEV